MLYYKGNTHATISLYTYVSSSCSYECTKLYKLCDPSRLGEAL